MGSAHTGDVEACHYRSRRVIGGSIGRRRGRHLRCCRSPNQKKNRASGFAVMGVLAGRKAIVTGANRGLGLEIARCFLAEGADVAVGARDEALLNAEVENLAKVNGGGRVVGRKLNVASE